MRPTDDYGTDHGGHGLQHHEPLYSDALHNEDVAHEHSDVNIRTLLMFALGLAAVTAFTFAAMRGVFVAFENMAAKNDPVLTPHARPAGELPPEPRIQDNLDEPAVLRKHREREQEDLTKYRWIDQTTGVAQLPIAEAKKLLLQRGVPYRADGPTDQWLGSRVKGASRGESSSGRAIPVTPGAAAEQPPAPVAAPAAPHKGH